MIVVVHEAVRVTDPITALVDVLEGIQEIDPILIAFENSLLFIPAGRDMVDCTGIFYSEWPGHNDKTVARTKANVNSKDLTLRCSQPTNGGSNSIMVCHDRVMIFARSLPAVVTITTGPGSSS
jgi:hypothetical protein